VDKNTGIIRTDSIEKIIDIAQKLKQKDNSFFFGFFRLKE